MLSGWQFRRKHRSTLFSLISIIHTAQQLYFFIWHCNTNIDIFSLHCRDQSKYTPRQWEMSLQCNDVFHWLGAYLDWSLIHLFTVGPNYCNLYYDNSNEYRLAQIAEFCIESPSTEMHFRKSVRICASNSLRYTVLQNGSFSTSGTFSTK